jgi:hypothetical protein
MFWDKKKPRLINLGKAVVTIETTDGRSFTRELVGTRGNGMRGSRYQFPYPARFLVKEYIHDLSKNGLFEIQEAEYEPLTNIKRVTYKLEDNIIEV